MDTCFVNTNRLQVPHNLMRLNIFRMSSHTSLYLKNHGNSRSYREDLSDTPISNTLLCCVCSRADIPSREQYTSHPIQQLSLCPIVRRVAWPRRYKLVQSWRLPPRLQRRAKRDQKALCWRLMVLSSFRRFPGCAHYAVQRESASFVVDEVARRVYEVRCRKG